MLLIRHVVSRDNHVEHMYRQFVCVRGNYFKNRLQNFLYTLYLTLSFRISIYKEIYIFTIRVHMCVLYK